MALLKILVCLAAAGLAEAACDATAYTKSTTACTETLTKCSGDSQSDYCKAAKCSVENLQCTQTASGDAGCCEAMAAGFDAARKAWDNAMEANKDAYKDCSEEDTKFTGECSGGGGSMGDGV